MHSIYSPNCDGPRVSTLEGALHPRHGMVQLSLGLYRCTTVFVHVRLSTSVGYDGRSERSEMNVLELER